MPDQNQTTKIEAGDTLPDRQWIDARLDEIGVRKKDVAQALGVHPNIVHKILNGERRLQVGEARTVAKLMQLPLVETLRRFGFNVPGTTCPLVGRIDGRGRVSIRPPSADGRTVLAPESAIGVVALAVDAAHSALSVYHGSLLYYEPAQMVRVDSFGRLAVLEMDGELCPVIGVLDRASLGRAEVTVFGGVEVLQTQRLVSATPILWQRFG